jgi:hypothetical protein
MTFGYGTKEFEVTTERLGCYRPEDHIDNPKDYADNLDARQYDRRLRGPVNERVELAVDQETGLKNYIANERIGITTSAGHVRDLFTRCIRLGRSYARNKNENDLFEALRLLGTGLHCLEDWSAHSNYCELALIEMGERDVFPHVGRNTQLRVSGARSSVYPLVTGTFGGVDFLHSVMGEFNDKATQSEIQQLEGALQNGQSADTSFLKNVLDKLPDGLFGGEDEKAKVDELRTNTATAQMNQARISPREPEAFTRQMQEYVKQIYPIMEWHDDTMKKISSAIERIPVLPDLIEEFENQLNIYVFSLIAPFMLPLLNQLKNELNTGSSEIISSSKDKQLIVFYDDDCTDPTHSMLSKDHFSNILNEPAGKIAAEVLKWVVPQIIRCWDDENEDENRVINRIINGVFSHPAVRQYGEDGASEGRQIMFRVVEKWWSDKSSREQQGLRRQLSREGVQNGENHKEGVSDTGHGSHKPLGMAKSSCGEGAGGGMISDLVTALGAGKVGSGSNKYGRNSPGQQASSHIEKLASEAAGGGALGGIVGAIAGGIGSNLLGGVFGKDEQKEEKKKYKTSDGGVQETHTAYGSDDRRTAQAQYAQTTYPSGEKKQEYGRFEQDRRTGESYGYQQKTDVYQTSGGGYEQREERRFEHGGEVRTEQWKHGQDASGRRYETEHQESKKKYGSKYDSGDDSDDKKKKNKSKKDKYKDDSDDDYKKSKKYGKKGKSDSEDDDDHRKKKDKSKKKYKDSEDDDSGDDDYKRAKKERKEREKREKREREEREQRGSGGYGGSSGYGGGGRRDDSEERRGGGRGYGGDENRRTQGSSGGYGGGGGGYGGNESSGYGQQRTYEQPEQHGYNRRGEERLEHGGASYGAPGVPGGFDAPSGGYGGRPSSRGHEGGGFGRQEPQGYGGGGYGGHEGGGFGRQEPQGYGGQPEHGRGGFGGPGGHRGGEEYERPGSREGYGGRGAHGGGYGQQEERRW